jgi:beta-hydroxylase
MTKASTSPANGIAAQLRSERRKRILRLGKQLRKPLGEFLARQSLVANAPVVENKNFPFLQPFVENWQAILGEAKAVLKHRDAVPDIQEVSKDQMRISKTANWKTFILYGFGSRCEKNCRQAPITARLLDAVPNIESAWFSILGPGSHILPHRGISKGILRTHLGLIIPAEAEKCRLRVGDTINVWRPGEIFVFDDTYEHEVWNDTDEERVILLFDFDRPMRFAGRAVNRTFISLLKLTAYYQEVKSKMATFEDRFEAATRRAQDNLEKLSDAD